MNNNFITISFFLILFFLRIFKQLLFFFQMEDGDNFMKIFFFPYNKIMIDKCSY